MRWLMGRVGIGAGWVADRRYVDSFGDVEMRKEVGGRSGSGWEWCRSFVLSAPCMSFFFLRGRLTLGGDETRGWLDACCVKWNVASVEGGEEEGGV